MTGIEAINASIDTPTKYHCRRKRHNSKNCKMTKKNKKALLFDKRGLTFFTAVFIYFQKKTTDEDLRRLIPVLRDWLANDEREFIKRYTLSILKRTGITKKIGGYVSLTKKGEEIISARVGGAQDIYEFMDNEAKKGAEVVRVIRSINGEGGAKDKMDSWHI